MTARHWSVGWNELRQAFRMPAAALLPLPSPLGAVLPRRRAPVGAAPAVVMVELLVVVDFGRPGPFQSGLSLSIVIDSVIQTVTWRLLDVPADCGTAGGVPGHGETKRYR